MEKNQILRKIYSIYPAIGAWARSGLPQAAALWSNSANAKCHIAEYVGPRASKLFMDSHHLGAQDRAFIQTTEALKALEEVADAIYSNRPLVDGLFPEDKNAEIR